MFDVFKWEFVFFPEMVKLGPKKVLNGSRLTKGRGSGYLGNAQIDIALFKKELLRVSPLFVISMTILR